MQNGNLRTLVPNLGLGICDQFHTIVYINFNVGSIYLPEQITKNIELAIAESVVYVQATGSRDRLTLRIIILKLLPLTIPEMILIGLTLSSSENKSRENSNPIWRPACKFNSVRVLIASS